MPLPRRLRSFSLRTLMVLLTVACLVCGWLGWESHRAAKRAAARVALKDKAAFVGFHDLFEPTVPQALLWVRRQFGDEAVFRVHLKRGKWTDADLQQVLSLFPEADVYRGMP